MGVIAELYGPTGAIKNLDDPSGGRFDAAGDFDRLISRFFPAQMSQLISEVDRLLPVAADGPDRRGLLRLRALATQCDQHSDTTVQITGD